MKKNFDVIITGAGIIGLSIALQLARRSTLRILVLEKGAAVGEGSTGASSAVCRFRYTLNDMVALARDGIHAYRHWNEFTGLKEPAAQFHNDGVLWIPGDDRNWADAEHARMAELNVATEVLDAADQKERFPALSTCTVAPDLVTGEPHDCVSASRSLLELDGGHIDPAAAAQDLVDACRARGVEVRFRARVSEIETSESGIRAVLLEDGSRIPAQLLINAAGPWCNDLYRAAGLDSGWELVPTRIQVLYLDCPESVPGKIPVSVDFQGGIYFRTQNRGRQLVVGSVLEDDEKEAVADPDHFNRLHDDDFMYTKLHALSHRIPRLPNRGQVRGYCGLYTVNRDDIHPIVGKTAVDGFWVANGFSGHGFKLAPAIGSMMARAITGASSEFDTDVPIDFFAVDRRPIDIAMKSVLA